jgi:hypothetical protein
MSSRRIAQLSRGALIPLILSLALVLGGACLVLSLTVRTNPAPAEEERSYTDLPGVDLSGLAPEKKSALLKTFNRLGCPCGCMRTVASCRNHHDSCSWSLTAARQAAAAARKR